MTDTSALPPAAPLHAERRRAADWFRTLRDEIVAAFEGVEAAHVSGPDATLPAGRFELTQTRRASDDGSDAGGGLMSVMRDGRVFDTMIEFMDRAVTTSVPVQPKTP